MFESKTVFVVGAGSSAELLLPTGDELRGCLTGALSPMEGNVSFENRRLFDAVRRICERCSPNWLTHYQGYVAASARLRAALPLAVSIDNLLDAHRDDELVTELGKLALAAVILEKEATSRLALLKSEARHGVKKANTGATDMHSSWFIPLMRLIVSGRTVQGIHDIFENVSFIVFNYDRCLEHFLVNAIIDYFDVRPSIAVDLVNNLTIIHPYGQVGYLGWQQPRLSQPPRADFGEVEADLDSIASGLLTFTQSAGEGVAKACKDLVSQADTLVFMGFGYLPQNMRLIRPLKMANVTRVFATMNGVGKDDVDIAIQDISHLIGRKTTMDQNGDRFYRAFIETGTCRSLMNNNWLRLNRPQFST